MNRERHRRAKELFLAAVRRPVGERRAALERSCGDDAELLVEVQELLAHDAGDDELLDTPAFDEGLSVIAAGECGEPPPRIGDYDVLERIGEGGMGVVYRARQRSPRRDVALKVLREPHPSELFLARFRREAELLGRLRHPGIAQVYEAGVAEGPHGPLPYLAMELVEGETLEAAQRSGRLDRRACLDLLIEVCDAVQHAHHKGIVHRDLKPQNVLVDERGRPRLLDFGIARTIGGDQTRATAARGGVVGTLQYMSPERLDGGSDEVDTRADVYAIGVMAYELLGGAPPFDLEGTSFTEAVRVILERTPTPLGRRDRTLRGDLETIAAKAMAKEPERRYSSCAALAEDLRRHLRCEPILARAAGPLYRLGKLVRRRRSAAAASLSVAVLAVVWLLREGVMGAEREAERTWERYRISLVAAEGALSYGDVGAARALLDACAPSVRGWEWQHLRLAVDQSREALADAGSAVIALASRENPALIVAGFGDGTLRAWQGEARTPAWEVSLGEDSRVKALALGGGGAPLAVALDTSAVVPQVVVLDPDDGSTRERISLGRAPYQLRALAVHPEGDLIAVTGVDGKVRLLGAGPDGWEQVRVLSPAHGNTVEDLAFTPDGEWIVSGSSDQTVRLWPVAQPDGEARTLMHPVPVTAVAALAEPPILVTGCDDGILRAFAIDDGRELWSLERPSRARPGGRVHDLAFEARRGMLAAARGDGTLDVWDLTTLEHEATLSGHDGEVLAATFVDAQGRLVSGGAGGRLLLWEGASVRPSYSMRALHDEEVLALAHTRDGRLAATLSADESVRLWDVTTGESVASLCLGAGVPRVLAFAPDEGRVITSFLSANRGGLRAIDVSDGAQMRGAAPHEGAILALAADSARGLLLTGGADGVVRSWDALRLEPRGLALEHPTSVVSLALHPSAAILASGDRAGDVRIWDVRSAQLLHELPGGGGPVDALAFHPDGGSLVSGTAGRRLRRWSATRGRLLAQAPATPLPVTAVAYTPGGERLAVGLADGSVELHDGDGLDPLVRLRPHARLVQALHFLPGERLISISNDRSVRVLEAAVDPGEVVRRRAAAEVRHRAWPVVDELLSELSRVGEVERRLLEDRVLDGDALAAARRRLRSRSDDPYLLNRRAWLVVHRAGRSPAQYAAALRWARVAAELESDPARRGMVQNTLGVALYRVGLHAEAVEVLEGSRELNLLRSPPHGEPSDLAVLAMAEERRGRRARARTWMAELEAVLQDLAFDPLVRRFYEEARRVLDEGH